MSTTYRFTVSKPTPCPFSGLHHADGDLLVLNEASLEFFAPNADGTPGRRLTDGRPLKSQTDVDFVKQWLADAVKAGTIADVAAPAKKAAKAEAKTDPPKQDAPPPPPSK